MNARNVSKPASFDPLPQQRAWNYTMRGLWIYAGFGLLVALVIPERLKTSSPAIAWVIDAIASAVPSLSPLAKISVHPDITALYLALMWCRCPLAILWVLRSAPKPPENKLSLKMYWLLIPL